MKVWPTILAFLERDGVAALVTVAEAKGSTPREQGARMMVRADGAFSGTIGSLTCVVSDGLYLLRPLPLSSQRRRSLGCRLRAAFWRNGCCSQRRLPPGNGGGQRSF